MRTRILLAAAVVMLAIATGRAQSFLALLQKGIYLQETVGDLEGAVRVYRQILDGAPAGDIRNQAQRRLDATEARRRTLAANAVGQPRRDVVSTPADLGVVEGRRYRHLATGLTFDVPEDSQVGRTGPSSDYGEMVSLRLKDPETEVNVWMIKTAKDWGGINEQLDAAPAMKAKSRIEQWGLADYRIREGSAQRTTFGGTQAIVAVGEYTSGGAPMVELLTWITSERGRAFFFSAVPAADLDKLRPQFEALVSSTIIP